MADPSPWQVTQAGRIKPVDPVIRTIFSRGTVPWPYAPQYVETVSAGTDVVVYGVNTHQPS